MKKILLTSLIALSTLSGVFAQDAVKEGHSYIVKDGKLVEAAPVAAAAPAITINNNITQVAPAPVAAAPAPVFVTPDPAPERVVYVNETAPNYEAPISLIKWSIETVNNHDWSALAPYMVNGHLNYFGTTKATLGTVRREMTYDAAHYGRWTANWDVNTFTRHSSNEYSSYWVGPMQYDEITAYVEVDEPGVRVHRALERLTVGYTYVGGELKIYALTMRVL